MDYPVPNFGVDHDIKATEASIKQAEGSVEHDWKPTQNADGTWNVPTAVQVGGKVAPIALASKMDSPSCSSDDGHPSAVGYCPKTIAARKEQGYFVNNNHESIFPP